MRHVIFRLGSDRYALPLDTVREVVPAPARYALVPRTPPEVRGVMTLRGRVIPIVDVGRLLTPGDGEGAAPPTAKIVLLELSRRELGLLVTEVEGIESLEKVNPAPSPSPMVRGLARVAALAVTVLELSGLDAAITAAFGAHARP